MDNRTAEIYDALIVGGGPAGASAAIRLALGGARVLLVEQKKFPRHKLCGEFISPECLEHFAALGVLDSMITAGGVKILETVFYTQGGRSLSVPSKWFGASTSANASTALGLSRAEMDRRLLMRAREAGVEVCEETQAVGLIKEGNRIAGVSLKMNGVEVRRVSSRVTIDATGRTRTLSRLLEKEEGQAMPKPRAALVAFKAHLEGARNNDGQCEIYSYRGGYGGLNSVENDLGNLCFIVAASDVKRCGSDAERVMREVVSQNKRAAYALENARVASRWLSVALGKFGRSALAPADGLLAIGDAASFIDPFTGSGMLMALESGEAAAQTVLRFLPQLRHQGNESLPGLARDYQEHYNQKFGARLRLCAVLRRAAFAPRLNEALIFALGTSEHARRMLARATRRSSVNEMHETREV